jgi:hypothetical protein
MRGVHLLCVLRELAKRLALIANAAFGRLVDGATRLGGVDHALAVGDRRLVNLDAAEEFILR